LDVRFVAPDLRKLDLLDAEAFALPVHSDERPLRGATGLLDWRLCGRFSRLVVRGRLTGQEGERLLVPTGGRLAFEKVVLVGAGPSAAFDRAHAVRTIRAMLEVLDGLRVRRAALALPGRTWELFAATDAMDVVSPMILEPHEQDALTIVEHPDEHRAMQRALESARRRHRADPV
jgi:hypothetical protein